MVKIDSEKNRDSGKTPHKQWKKYIVEKIKIVKKIDSENNIDSGKIQIVKKNHRQ